MIPPANGRGAAHNPANRFERTHYAPDPDAEIPDEDRTTRLATEFIADRSRTVIATNDSPDIPFDASLNPYRGCEHGCSYCFARPTHEYLGFSAGLDFETKILVKHDAPELLRRELASDRWQPKTISISGVTDPYQPVERRLELTRRCLEVLLDFRNPFGIVTKNRLVCRDRDILAEMASFRACAVYLSVTTLDGRLARSMEPRASAPAARLAAIEMLTKAGVPVGVMVAPLIPGLNDHEVPAILRSAASAGAKVAAYVPLRLPGAVRDVFLDWLDRHQPGRKAKVLSRLSGLREGRLYDPRFGHRMQAKGPMGDAIAALFDASCRRLGLNLERIPLSTDSFRRPGAEHQGRLFD